MVLALLSFGPPTSTYTLLFTPPVRNRAYVAACPLSADLLFHDHVKAPRRHTKGTTLLRTISFHSVAPPSLLLYRDEVFQLDLRFSSMKLQVFCSSQVRAFEIPPSFPQRAHRQSGGGYPLNISTVSLTRSFFFCPPRVNLSSPSSSLDGVESYEEPRRIQPPFDPPSISRNLTFSNFYSSDLQAPLSILRLPFCSNSRTPVTPNSSH